MSNPYLSTSAAERYDSGRWLSNTTASIWVALLRSVIREDIQGFVLDAGCGTGRFTVLLSEIFSNAVLGLDPSEPMLRVARGKEHVDIRWHQGCVEFLPFQSETAGLIFMSQVFHHIKEPAIALDEIRRILRPGGYFGIRNATKEVVDAVIWLTFFPEAAAIDRQRVMSRAGLANLVCSNSFTLVNRQSIQEFSAASPQEYFERVSQRGLSALLAISDEQFEAGLIRMQEWVKSQSPAKPIWEDLDFFLFRRQ